MQNVCPSSYFLSKTHLFQNMAGGYVYGIRLSPGFTEILSCVRAVTEVLFVKALIDGTSAGKPCFTTKRVQYQTYHK